MYWGAVHWSSTCALRSPLSHPLPNPLNVTWDASDALELVTTLWKPPPTQLKISTGGHITEELAGEWWYMLGVSSLLLFSYLQCTTLYHVHNTPLPWYLNFNDNIPAHHINEYDIQPCTTTVCFRSRIPHHAPLTPLSCCVQQWERNMSAGGSNIGIYVDICILNE